MMIKPVSSRCNLSCEYCYYRKYGLGRKIMNTLQTNATLLTDEMCEFFRDNRFLLGVSIDGPEELHNKYRSDSFAQAVKGIELLRKYNVPFNTLTAINDTNSQFPEKVYSFLRGLSDYMQFLPVVEMTGGKIAHFSVRPEQWGNFLCEVLRMWLKYDAGRKHVQLIDAALENMRRIPCSLCVHNPLCGHSGSVEANGNVYSCDRYAFPSHYLGNLLDTDLKILMDMNRDFGMLKTYGLPEECLDCAHVKLCFGGCPVHRPNAGKIICAEATGSFSLN